MPITQVIAQIEQAEKIAITTHSHPDADGIGSEVALALALKQLNKNVVCIHPEALSNRYKYLDPNCLITEHHKFIKESPDAKFDLLIVVDTNSLNRIGHSMQEFKDRCDKCLFIDHHPYNGDQSELHCIDSQAAATGELIYKLLEELNVEITPEMALPLYTAILIDTNSFRYPSVTCHTHEVIAKLMAHNKVAPPKAYDLVYGTRSISNLKLLGKILGQTEINQNKTIAWLSITEELLKEYDIDPEETNAFINHLLVLNHIKIACLFREENGKIKTSLRSSSLNVGDIARSLSGGGHEHASAFITEGKLVEVIPEVIEKLEKMI